MRKLSLPVERQVIVNLMRIVEHCEVAAVLAAKLLPEKESICSALISDSLSSFYSRILNTLAFYPIYY